MNIIRRLIDAFRGIQDDVDAEIARVGQESFERGAKEAGAAILKSLEVDSALNAPAHPEVPVIDPEAGKHLNPVAKAALYADRNRVIADMYGDLTISVGEIAAKFGISSTRVLQIGTKAGHKPRKRFNKLANKLAVAAKKPATTTLHPYQEAYRRYKSLRVTALALGKSKQAVYAKLKELGEPMGARGNPRRGRNRFRGTNEGLRLAAQRMFLAGGKSKAGIAKELGVSRTTVFRATADYVNPNSQNSINSRSETWNNDTIATLKDVWGDASYSLPQIAELIGVSEGAIRTKAWRMNLGRRPESSR